MESVSNFVIFLVSNTFLYALLSIRMFYEKNIVGVALFLQVHSKFE